MTNKVQQFQFELTAEPPRVLTSHLIANDHDVMWATVIGWVDGQIKLIKKICAGVRPFYPGDNKDIYNQALLTGFEALQTCAQKGRIDDFVPVFCVKFRTVIINTCQNVPIDRSVNIEKLETPVETCPHLPGVPWPQHLPLELHSFALFLMAPRQSEIWAHYLYGWDAQKGYLANTKSMGLSAKTYYETIQDGIKRVGKMVGEGMS